MDNKIKRDALQVLANAPAIAAKAYIKSLKNDGDKKQAIALFQALNVLAHKTTKTE